MLNLITGPFKGYIYGALALTLVASITGSYFYGRSSGIDHQTSVYEKAKEKTQKEIFRLGDELSKKSLELEKTKRIKNEKVIVFEKQATEAVGSNSPGINANGGLQRLENRWRREN